MRISRDLLLGMALSLSIASLGLSALNLDKSGNEGEPPLEAVRDRLARQSHGPTGGWHVHPVINFNERLLGRAVGRAGGLEGWRQTRDLVECDWDLVVDSDAEYPLCRLDVLFAAPCYAGDVLLRPALDYRTEPPTEVVGASVREGQFCDVSFAWNMPRWAAGQNWQLFIEPHDEAP